MQQTATMLVPSRREFTLVLTQTLEVVACFFRAFGDLREQYKGAKMGREGPVPLKPIRATPGWSFLPGQFCLKVGIDLQGRIHWIDSSGETGHGVPVMRHGPITDLFRDWVKLWTGVEIPCPSGAMRRAAMYQRDPELYHQQDLQFNRMVHATMVQREKVARWREEHFNEVHLEEAKAAGRRHAPFRRPDGTWYFKRIKALKTAAAILEKPLPVPTLQAGPLEIRLPGAEEEALDPDGLVADTLRAAAKGGLEAADKVKVRKAWEPMKIPFRWAWSRREGDLVLPRAAGQPLKVTRVTIKGKGRKPSMQKGGKSRPASKPAQMTKEAALSLL